MSLLTNVLKLWRTGQYLLPADSGFMVKHLFANSEPGAWYDPSDMSTLFQDEAGTTPVTAVEQPVGRILDKSKGLVLGPELVTNGYFSNGTTGWSAYNAVISAVNGTLKVDDSSNLGSNSSAVQQLNLVAGRTYLLTFDVVSVSGTWSVGFATTDSSVGITFPSAMLSKNTTGPQRYVFTYDGTRNFLFMDADGSGIVFYDNISVKELPGNHASQATTTKRGVVSRRVNWLTKTEDFQNGTWITPPTGAVRSNNAGTDPLGGGTAGKVECTQTTSIYVANSVPSGVITGATYRATCHVRNGVGVPSITFYNGKYGSYKSATINLATGAVTGSNYATPPVVSVASDGWVTISVDIVAPSQDGNYCYVQSSASNAIGDHFFIWQPSLTLETDSHLPYQWVNTATDYDADPNKFPTYIRLDGVDDAYQTNSIDFTGTDKMTVWAGVTKLSDAAFGNVASCGLLDSGGGFYLVAPANGATYGARSSGTVLSALTEVGGYPAPHSAVLCGVFDVAGRKADLRIGGVITANGTDQGTGSYSARPIAIGANPAGTSLFFNGRLYSLIVRGAQSSQSQIEATELYVKRKMRLP